MVTIRRQWSQNLEIPGLGVSSLRYGSNCTCVLLTLGFQSLEFVLKLPIDVRVQLNSLGAVALTAYNYRAFSALRTWGQVARNAAWGGFLPFSVVLEVRGLGYRVSAPSAQLLEFSLGFSHLVFFTLPTSLTARNLGNKSRAVQLASVD